MAGVPTVFPTLLYRDAKAAIRLLTEAFGFTQLAVYEGDDGAVMHAELSYGSGAVMLGSKGRGGAFDRAMAQAG
ncbi:glyoxalase, partial [Streptomyces sp. NPDC048551]